MKILFIRTNPVRPDSRVEKEVTSLYNNGYKVSVLGWDRNDNYPLRSEPLNETLNEVIAFRVGIKANYGSGIKNLKYFLKFQKEIWKFLNNNKYDVVHACDFDTAFTAFHSIDHNETKLVYDIFDYYADAFAIPAFFRKTIIALDRRLINQSDIVIICTEQRREQIIGTKPKRLIVIHNCPPNTMVNTEISSKVKGEKIKVAYFGILSTSRLIKEMIKVISENQIYELHIGGFGVLENYVKDAAANYSNIIYYGTVPYKKVLMIESECDILTAIYDPSVRNHYYAAPNKFYESLMFGKPVIMAKNTGMSDVLEKNRIGTTIEFSESGFRDGLCKLAKIQKEWPNMASRMVHLYNEQYSWKEMEKRLISAYGSLENGGEND